VLDRRGSRRFAFNPQWQILVKGTSPNGKEFYSDGDLGDLSSTGALVLSRNRLIAGDRVQLLIKLPVQKTSWMKYQAEVVRVVELGGFFEVALRFEKLRPEFLAHPIA
jgi:hypothetical protein